MTTTVSDDGTSSTTTFNECKLSGQVDGSEVPLITYDGTISYQMSGAIVTITANQFHVIDHIPEANISEVYYESFTMTQDTTTHETNATLTGYIVLDDDTRIDYDEYKMHIVGDTVSFEGRIKTSCLDGWFTVTTVTPIPIDTASEDDTCPTGGKLRATGDGGTVLEIEFTSTGGVNVYLNGSVIDTYDTCYEMPDGCPVSS